MCYRAFACPTSLQNIKDPIVDGNLMNIFNVVKTFQNFGLHFYKRTHTGKNLMNVISVVKHLQIIIICNHIKDHIQERNCMNVISMVNPLYVIILYTYTRESTLDRTLVNVITVYWQFTLICKDIIQCIQESNPVNVISLLTLIIFIVM